MHELRFSTQQRVGPYWLVGDLVDGPATLPVAERVQVARNADRTVLLTAPSQELAPDGERRGRFRAEAEQARQLSGVSPWLEPVTDVFVGDDHETPVRVSAYTPAISLPEVLGVHGGPLPITTLYAVGSLLAESLSALHSRAFAHAGVSPQSVLITARGIRLTGFGTVRVAGHDGHDRSGLASLINECLAPEQLTGGRPRPPGDVFALGAVLAYAATGHLTPESSELPAELRSVIKACLRRDPAHRPSASEVLDELTRGGLAGGSRTVPSQGSTAVPQPSQRSATALDSSVSRAAGLLTPGWLPRKTSAALAAQARAVLAAETSPEMLPDTETEPEGIGATGAVDEQATVPPQRGGAAGGLATTATTTVSAAVTRIVDTASRRRVLTAATGGTLGLAIGAGATWAATAEEPPAPTPAERLAAARPSRKRVPGTAPSPSWRYEIPGGAPRFAPLIPTREIVVAANGAGVHGVDLRSGKRVWHASSVRATGHPQSIANGLVLIPGQDLMALDPRDGAVRWRARDSRRYAHERIVSLLAVRQSVVWFAVRNSRAQSSKDALTAIAYDVAKKHELWREEVPDGFTEGHLVGDNLVLTTPTSAEVAGASGDTRPLVALNCRTGAKRWDKQFQGVAKGQWVEASGHGWLVVADGARLKGYEVAGSSAPRWSVKSKGKREKERPLFGPPVIHESTVFATDLMGAPHAVDLKTGRVKWQSEAERQGGWFPDDPRPETFVSPGGRLVFSADVSAVAAHDARGGSLLWRFVDLPDRKRPAKGRRRVALTDTTAVVQSQDCLYALPLD